jgi:hypothetical protein
MLRKLAFLLAPIVLFGAACGGGGGSATKPASPTSPAVRDANGDGIYDSSQPTAAPTATLPPAPPPTLPPIPTESQPAGSPPSDDHTDMPEIRSSNASNHSQLDRALAYRKS